MNTAANNGVRTMDEAFEKLLQADTHPENISEALRRNAPMDPGPTLVPVKRYTSRVYHELEREQLWKKSWQVACHEDDMPNVCLLYTSPSPRDLSTSRMPSSA